MIIEYKMTGKELIDVCLKHREEIEKTYKKMTSPLYKKIMKKLKRCKNGRMLLNPRQITIGDVNFYVTSLIKLGYGGHALLSRDTIYCISQNKSGKNVVVQFKLSSKTISPGDNVIEDKPFVYVYENHLLDRYRERYLGLDSSEISFEDLVHKFMRDMGSEVSTIRKTGTTKTGQEKFECRMDDGIYFGVVEDDQKHRFITFITEDMATREGQELIRDVGPELTDLVKEIVYSHQK